MPAQWVAFDSRAVERFPRSREFYGGPEVTLHLNNRHAAAVRSELQLQSRAVQDDHLDPTRNRASHVALTTIPIHVCTFGQTSPYHRHVSRPARIHLLSPEQHSRTAYQLGGCRAKTITEEDLKKIKAIDKVRKEQRKQTIEGDVKTYTQLLLGGDNVKSIFESAAKRTDILQYMLVLAGDLVDGTRAQISLVSRPHG
jgi:hypothetical protein